MNKIFKITTILFLMTCLFLITSCKSKYTVTFKDYDGTIIKEEIVKENSSATPPKDPERVGYTFIGWDKEYKNITSDLVITAQYNKTIKEYTVTFIDFDGTVLKEETVKEGSNATLPKDPERVGYIFLGWSENYQNITKDLFIIAQYEKETKEYIVTFIDFDGTLLKEEKVKENSSAIPPQNPERVGYTFLGWSESLTNITSDKVIVALYKQNEEITSNKCTVTFNTNSETIIENQYLEKGENITEPVTPTKKGYTFLGWYLNNEKWNFIGYVVSKDITLDAKWEINTYQINYTMNGGYSSNPILYTVEDEITLNNPTKEGYTFIGWTTKDNHTLIFYQTIKNEIGNKHFYANFTPNTYTLSFDVNGGEESYDDIDITYDTTYNITTQIPTRKGYTFLGWYNGSTKLTSGTWKFANNIYLQAHWQINTYDLIYELNGGTVVNPSTYTVEDKITLNNPTKEGYTFLGWTTEDCDIPYLDFEIYNESNDLKFTANWSNLEFILKETDEYEVTGYLIKNSTYNNLEIPKYYNGKKITSIKDKAFSWCSNLTNVEIPNSVTNIGSSAFSCCFSLTSIEIPNSVISIGDYAFSLCRSLTSIEIPNSITSIGKYAFSDCDNLTSIEIPNSVTSIGYGAFSSCINLTNVEIPNSVTIIGDHAFSCCPSLTSIIIPNSVTSIGDYAFSSCSNLTSINVDKNNLYYQSIDGNLYSKDGKILIKCAIGKIDSSFEIPSSVTSIGVSAFYGCKSLISIEIPNSVTSIGASAFRYCDSLTTIIIPNSVTSIGDMAFESCKSLTSIEIPNSVTSIGHGAFSDCDSLTSIIIPKSVTSIGDGTFRSCDSLTSVIIPNSVTSIGNSTFYDCYSLTSVIIPNSVTSIEDYAFEYCYKLTIYCEATSAPSGWDSDWNSYNCPVVWGYKK